jgi:adenylyltransferase/sulfurtransferase
MDLTDAQIDRFSRQIVLPQIGGTGQKRLLASSVAIAGDSALTETVALYLAGAGIGRIALFGATAAALRGELLALHPDAQVSAAHGSLAECEADLLVACDLPLAALDAATANGRPVIAGGAASDRGWLVIAVTPEICGSCAARAAGGRDAAVGGLTPAAGVIGSLMSLGALKARLGLGAPTERTWFEFDARRAMLSEHRFDRTTDCPVCRPR